MGRWRLWVVIKVHKSIIPTLKSDFVLIYAEADFKNQSSEHRNIDLDQ
jgi:hypothetical protein